MTDPGDIIDGLLPVIFPLTLVVILGAVVLVVLGFSWLLRRVR